MSGSKSFPPAGGPAPETAAVADQPLGLTVHSLPDMNAESLQFASRTRSARIKLLLLLLVCAAPVIASYFTYYVIRPEGRRNYGELINPQRPLPDVAVTDPSGRAGSLTQLRHQWLLVTVADSTCDAVCERNLFISRQLREGLGKDRARVEWVWLRTGESPVRGAAMPGLASAEVLTIAEADVAAWLQPAPGQALADHIYVVDPMGNWMMRFPANLDPAKARKDLERLMRASSSWDQDGRPQ